MTAIPQATKTRLTLCLSLLMLCSSAVLAADHGPKGATTQASSVIPNGEAEMFPLEIFSNFVPGSLFSSPIDSFAGPEPAGMAAGDFNGDGQIDLAVSNQGCCNFRNHVKILLGNGDGHFQPPIGYKVGVLPSWISVADFNRDGKPDLAVVNPHELGSRRGRVSILVGKGDGTFAEQVKYKAGPYPIMAAVGDFNGDGFLDLAVAQPLGPIFSLLEGNGDGTFRPQIKVRTGHIPTYMVAGDLNNDGKPDLVVISNGATYKTFALLGNGDGTFRTAWTVGSRTYSGGISLGDFNGDGKLDLAQTYPSPDKLTIRLGNGDGTFRDGPHYKIADMFGPFEVADFNHDGTLDIAAIAIDEFLDSSVNVLLGRGDGTFTPESSYPWDPHTYPGVLIASDINSDGRPDLVTADYGNGNVEVLLNTSQ